MLSEALKKQEGVIHKFHIIFLGKRGNYVSAAAAEINLKTRPHALDTK